MLASGTLLSGLPQPVALLCSPVGRSGSQHSPSELCQAETSHKTQRRCFISCSECASPLSKNTSALTEFSQGFCCVLKLRESPVPARLRGSSGSPQSGGKALGPSSPSVWQPGPWWGQRCPPTAGQHQEGGSGGWQGYSRGCPSICSLHPASTPRTQPEEPSAPVGMGCA